MQEIEVLEQTRCVEAHKIAFDETEHYHSPLTCGLQEVEMHRR